MRIMLLGVLGVATSASLVACGGNSCEDAIANAAKIYGFGGSSYGSMRAQGIAKCKDEKWPEKARSCVASAKTRSDVDGCEKYMHEGGAAEAAAEYGKKSKRSEAELHLDYLKKSLKVAFVENAEFPRGSAPLTPSTPCCEGPNHKCPAEMSQWSTSDVWTKLDFEIDEPGYFQYTYDSDGTTVTATAVGDLDCDGETITYTLTGNVTNGTPSFTLTKPARID